jgi:programmed cell death protein 10
MNTEENLDVYSSHAISSLALSNVIYPILDKMEKDDHIIGAKSILKNAFSELEDNPHVALEFIEEIMKIYNKKINLNEMILRAESKSSDDSFVIKRVEFKELNYRAKQLKIILSRIPDEITDRKAFLETIKEIASAIKKKLDAVNTIFDLMPSQDIRQTLDIRKREFVKYSKLFSNTLKQYFRQGQADEVFAAAICLISQTNLILKTLKVNFD